MKVRSGNRAGSKTPGGKAPPGRPAAGGDAGARDQRGRPLAEDPHHRRAAGGDAGARRGRGRPLVDDKRRRILDAALRVFAARGYHGTSVPEVAETAKVGVGTLYRYFEDKNALVNEVYRDAKQRLKDALLDGLAAPDVYQLDNAEHWFSELWRRLATFARAEPDAFRFLEMQDHVEYLDAKSRALELSVLAPLWLAGKRLRDRSGGPPVDIAIALLWGAFVGLVKASRLGYLELDDRKLEQAGEAAWRIVAPTVSRASDERTRKAPTVPRASDERTRKAPTVPRASDERTRRAPTVSRASDDRTRRAPTVSRASDDRERATRSDSRRHSRRSLYDPKG